MAIASDTASTDTFRDPVSLPAGASSTTVQGTAAGNAAAVGNPVQTGGIYESTPSTYDNGDAVPGHYDSRGNLRVALVVAEGTNTPQIATYASDGLATSGNTRLTVRADLMAYNNSTTDRVRADVNGLVTQPHAFAANRWAYAAAASGIVNTTTAVPLVAAAGGSTRNYITGMQLDWDALGAATEIAVRDGAGGTVLWRGKIQAGSAGSREITFTSPRRGTANTLLEFVTLTASVTGAVYVNAGGFQGT